MRSAILIICIFIFYSCNNNIDTSSGYPVKPVDIKNVRLTDNFWLQKIKTIVNTTIPYAFDKCTKEGRMDNFLIAGGKMEGETRGAMPFDDTDVYKIIEGASYSLIIFPDEELEAYLDSVITIISIGQEDDGYLTTWRTINPRKPPAGWVKPGGRWEHLESSHELYNSGHMFEAAAAHYKATGKTNFLEIAVKNADLLVETFGPGKNIQIPGHQIVETGLIKLYHVTGNKKYKELAKHFLDQRGNDEVRELIGPYCQDHIPVIQQDEVTGHAVRATYMYAGMTDIAAIYRDTAYLKAVNKLWENMVNKKLYITGGIGARHEGESFGDNYELPNLTAYSETCAAIGSVYWSHRMFLLSGDVKYYDIIERTLYNGVISGISLAGDRFFYTNPLEADGKYAFNHGACTRQSWFDCSCCPTNLIRFIPSVPGLIYATLADSLFINLFVSNEAIVRLTETDIQVSQKTDYPWNGDISISVSPSEKRKFSIKLRVPCWANNKPLPGNLYKYVYSGSEKISLKINGEEEDPVYKNGYIELTRNWKKGDAINITLPMEVRRVAAHENISENKNLIAIERGPIVYCAEEIDNPGDFSQLTIPADAEFQVEKREDLLNGVNVITCICQTKSRDTANKIVLVPYYAWSNRGVGKMKVWIQD